MSGALAAGGRCFPAQARTIVAKSIFFMPCMACMTLATCAGSSLRISSSITAGTTSQDTP
jgi:hypothetical protein